MLNIVPKSVFGLVYDRMEVSPATFIAGQSLSWEVKLFTVDGDPNLAIKRQISVTEDIDEFDGTEEYIIEKSCEELGVSLKP